VALNLSTSEPLNYHIWGAMLENYNNLHPKPKTTDELKVALQTIWEELPQEHGAPRTRQQGGGELQQVLNCLHGCGCQRWSLQAFKHLSVSKSASSPRHQPTAGEDNARNAMKW